MDAAIPFQLERRRAVANIPDGHYAVVFHPGVPISGRFDTLLRGGFVARPRDRVGKPGEPAAAGDPAAQVRQFQMAMRIDHARDQQAAEKLHPLLRIDRVGGGDFP